MQQTTLYSITSSARASSMGGMVRPSARAVRRLITKSNLVDCATGRSIGLLPFRMNAGVEAHLTIRFRQADPVAHQAAGFGVRARVIDRGQGMARRQPG